MGLFTTGGFNGIYTLKSAAMRSLFLFFEEKAAYGMENNRHIKQIYRPSLEIIESTVMVLAAQEVDSLVFVMFSNIHRPLKRIWDLVWDVDHLAAHTYCKWPIPISVTTAVE